LRVAYRNGKLHRLPIITRLEEAAPREAAGVPGRIPHDFRRTAVRNLERAGVPRSVAMKITGHRTESVYRRYAIVSAAELREATARLTGTITGTVTPRAITGPDASMRS